MKLTKQEAKAKENRAYRDKLKSDSVRLLNDKAMSKKRKNKFNEKKMGDMKRLKHLEIDHQQLSIDARAS